MRRLDKLNNLTNYLTALRAPGLDIEPLRVIDEAQTTTRLARRSGTQIVIARPEFKQEGSADSYTTEYSTAIFVVEKALGAASTDEREDAQFSDLVGAACGLLTKIEQDVSSCVPLLSGLDLINVELFPVSSIFGGWNGYSIVLAFK